MRYLAERRTLRFALACMSVFPSLSVIGCGSEQSDSTTPTEQPSSTDPDIAAGQKLVQNPCVRDWYNDGGVGSLDEACPGWDD